MTAGSDVSLEITGDLTIELWINGDAMASNSRFVQFGAAGETSNVNFLYMLRLAAGGDISMLHESGSGSNSEEVFDANLVAGQWYHLAIVRDVAANTYTLYVNGALFATQIYASDPTGGADGLLRISKAETSGGFFDGRIDDVRIWNDPRTAQEIANNMQVAVPGDSANLVAYWKFDEGSGTAVEDSAAAGVNDGTLFGDPAWLAISQDCNMNGMPDPCDIGGGGGTDDNSNGIPDECETPDCACPGDLTGDGLIDGDDVACFIAEVISDGGQCASPACADIDDDDDLDAEGLAGILRASVDLVVRAVPIGIRQHRVKHRRGGAWVEPARTIVYRANRMLARHQAIDRERSNAVSIERGDTEQRVAVHEPDITGGSANSVAGAHCGRREFGRLSRQRRIRRGRQRGYCFPSEQELIRPRLFGAFIVLITIYAGGVTVVAQCPDNDCVAVQGHCAAELVTVIGIGRLDVGLDRPGCSIAHIDIGRTRRSCTVVVLRSIDARRVTVFSDGAHDDHIAGHGH